MSANRIDSYKVIRMLGKGSTCKVKLCQNLDTKEVFALKIYNPTKVNLMQIESSAMERVRSHPNIVYFHESVTNGTYFKDNGIVKHVSYLVLDVYPNGEIFDYVSELGPFPEEIARKLFNELIDAVEFLSDSGLVHRDIKPENIFFGHKFELKLSDFGFAAPVQGFDGSGLLHSYKGTRPYMAPEILERRPYNGPSTDLFSCGIILFIFIYGRPPFARAERANPHYSLIVAGNWEKFWQTHSGRNNFHPSDSVKKLIQSMLAFDPAGRGTFAQVKTSEWMSGPKGSEEECSRFMERLKVRDLELVRLVEHHNAGHRGEIELVLSRDNSLAVEEWEHVFNGKCSAWISNDFEKVKETAVDFLKEYGQVLEEKENVIKISGEFDGVLQIFKHQEKFGMEFRRLAGDRWDFYKVFDRLLESVRGVNNKN